MLPKRIKTKLRFFVYVAYILLVALFLSDKNVINK